MSLKQKLFCFDEERCQVLFCLLMGVWGRLITSQHFFIQNRNNMCPVIGWRIPVNQRFVETFIDIPSLHFYRCWSCCFHDNKAEVDAGPVWDHVQFGLHCLHCLRCPVIGYLPVIMQLTSQKLPAQLRQNSRVKKVAVVLLAAYAFKKLSPYVWIRIQVTHTRMHTHTPTQVNR